MGKIATSRGLLTKETNGSVPLADFLQSRFWLQDVGQISHDGLRKSDEVHEYPETTVMNYVNNNLRGRYDAMAMRYLFLCIFVNGEFLEDHQGAKNYTIEDSIGNLWVNGKRLPAFWPYSKRLEHILDAEWEFVKYFKGRQVFDDSEVKHGLTIREWIICQNSSWMLMGNMAPRIWTVMKKCISLDRVRVDLTFTELSIGRFKVTTYRKVTESVTSLVPVPQLEIRKARGEFHRGGPRHPFRGMTIQDNLDMGIWVQVDGSFYKEEVVTTRVGIPGRHRRKRR
jgi:hypothetical protein